MAPSNSRYSMVLWDKAVTPQFNYSLEQQSISDKPQNSLEGKSCTLLFHPLPH